MTKLTKPRAASSIFDDLLDQGSSRDKILEGTPETRIEPIDDEHMEPSQVFEDDVDLPETSGKSVECQNDTLGNLPPEAKKALVHIYRSGSILLTQNKDRYETLCKYENAVRMHMSEVYMDVIFDKKAGHIFTQISAPDDNDEEPARLVTAKPLSVYQSILLVVLRKYFQERETAGEQRIIIDIERLTSFLVPYLELTHSTRKDTDKLKRAISSMVDKRVLINIRGEEERFQISPIIRNVVNAEFLEDLLIEYKSMLEINGSESESQGSKHNG